MASRKTGGAAASGRGRTAPTAKKAAAETFTQARPAADSTEPPLGMKHITCLHPGDTLLACSDGLWHYFAPKELGAIVHTQPPRESAEMLVSKARHRARGGGDNLSLALVRIEE